MDDISFQSQSTAGIILGDGIIYDDGVYSYLEECRFEYGDCAKGQIGRDIVLSPTTSRITDFNFWMSADGSKILVDMTETKKATEKYGSTGNDSKIAGYIYKYSSLSWEHDESLDTKILPHISIDLPEDHSMAVAGDGSIVAWGSPYYDDRLNGHVDIVDYESLCISYVMIAVEHHSKFGAQVDLTGVMVHVLQCLLLVQVPLLMDLLIRERFNFLKNVKTHLMSSGHNWGMILLARGITI